MASIRKKVFEIDIPVIEQTASALSLTQDGLVGKFITMDLTRILKGKNAEASFEIVKEGNGLVGKPHNLLILPSYIRRIMRKGVSYVEDSFVCKTKDGTIILKPFMLTRKKVHRRVRNSLNQKTREILGKTLPEKTTEEVFSLIFSSRLQKVLSVELKRIYPLSFFEFRIAKAGKQ